MPLKKEAIEYALKLNNKFLNSIRTFYNKEDNIHGLRVQIKKHKAILKLFKPAINKIDYQLYTSRLRVIFKKAAKPREHHAYLKLSKELKNKKLQAAILKKMKQQQVDLLQYINKNKVGIFLEFKKLNSALLAIKENSLKQYYEKKYIKITEQLTSIDKITIHELRKNAKEYFYNIKFYSAVASKIIKRKHSYIYLNKLQVEIGRWHDLALLQRKIKTKFYKVDNSTRKHLLEIIEEKKENAWINIIEISGRLISKS